MHASRFDPEAQRRAALRQRLRRNAYDNGFAIESKIEKNLVADRLDDVEGCRQRRVRIVVDEDEILGALTDRQREQLFQLLQKAAAGHALDCAGAAVEREPEC